MWPARSELRVTAGVSYSRLVGCVHRELAAGRSLGLAPAPSGRRRTLGRWVRFAVEGVLATCAGRRCRGGTDVERALTWGLLPWTPLAFLASAALLRLSLARGTPAEWWGPGPHPASPAYLVVPQSAGPNTFHPFSLHGMPGRGPRPRGLHA